MNALYGEVGILHGNTESCVLVITQAKGLMVQTREGHMVILPRDTTLFCYVEGPAAAWLGAMDRLQQTKALVYDYGEEAYHLSQYMMEWMTEGDGPSVARPSEPLLPSDVPF